MMLKFFGEIREVLFIIIMLNLFNEKLMFEFCFVWIGIWNVLCRVWYCKFGLKMLW